MGWPFPVLFGGARVGFGYFGFVLGPAAGGGSSRTSTVGNFPPLLVGRPNQ